MLDEVIATASDPTRRVVDVRPKERFRGDSDPFETPGHIPGAVNVPYLENLGPDGKFLPPAGLEAQVNRVLGGLAPEDVIIHCGSGVTACHTLLAIAATG